MSKCFNLKFRLPGSLSYEVTMSGMSSLSWNKWQKVDCFFLLLCLSPSCGKIKHYKGQSWVLLSKVKWVWKCSPFLLAQDTHDRHTEEGIMHKVLSVHRAVPVWSHVVWGSCKIQMGTSPSWQTSAQIPEHQEACRMWWTLEDFPFGNSHVKSLVEVLQFSALFHYFAVQLDLNVYFCLSFEDLTEICTASERNLVVWCSTRRFDSQSVGVRTICFLQKRETGLQRISFFPQRRLRTVAATNYMEPSWQQRYWLTLNFLEICPDLSLLQSLHPQSLN